MTADQYNAAELAAGRLTQAMLDVAGGTSAGVAAVQRKCGLTADGMAGPKTRLALAALVADRTPIPTGRAVASSSPTASSTTRKAKAGAS